MNESSTSESRQRMRFIVKYGVLGWGLLTGGLWAVGFSMWSDLPLLAILCGSLLVFPLGGYGFGALMWKLGVGRQNA